MFRLFPVESSGRECTRRQFSVFAIIRSRHDNVTHTDRFMFLLNVEPRWTFYWRCVKRVYRRCTQLHVLHLRGCSSQLFVGKSEIKRNAEDSCVCCTYTVWIATAAVAVCLAGGGRMSFVSRKSIKWIFLIVVLLCIIGLHIYRPQRSDVSVCVAVRMRRDVRVHFVVKRVQCSEQLVSNSRRATTSSSQRWCLHARRRGRS